MTRNLCPICVGIAVGIAVTAFGQRLRVSEEYSYLKKEFISTPTPTYTMELRRSHITGSGIFTLSVDEKGKVIDVTVRKSTGHRALDAQAIYGLNQWRAKPGARRQIDVPLTFSLAEKRGPSL
jgi:TonB family protein